MQTTIIIDDTRWARANACTGLAEASAVIHQALHALIARESAPPCGDGRHRAHRKSAATAAHKG